MAPSIALAKVASRARPAAASNNPAGESVASEATSADPSANTR